MRATRACPGSALGDDPEPVARAREIGSPGVVDPEHPGHLVTVEPEDPALPALSSHAPRGSATIASLASSRRRARAASSDARCAPLPRVDARDRAVLGDHPHPASRRGDAVGSWNGIRPCRPRPPGCGGRTRAGRSARRRRRSPRSCRSRRGGSPRRRRVGARDRSRHSRRVRILARSRRRAHRLPPPAAMSSGRLVELDPPIGLPSAGSMRTTRRLLELGDPQRARREHAVHRVAADVHDLHHARLGRLLGLRDRAHDRRRPRRAAPRARPPRQDRAPAAAARAHRARRGAARGRRRPRAAAR